MTTNTFTIGRSPIEALGEALRTALTFIGRNSPGARCAQEADRLFALTDAELAEMNLTRDRVVQHAFRRYLHV